MSSILIFCGFNDEECYVFLDMHIFTHVTKYIKQYKTSRSCEFPHYNLYNKTEAMPEAVDLTEECRAECEDENYC